LAVLIRRTLGVVRWLVAVPTVPDVFAGGIPSDSQHLLVDHFPNSVPQEAAHFWC
jgi:hypothetical protein